MLPKYCCKWELKQTVKVNICKLYSGKGPDRRNGGMYSAHPNNRLNDIVESILCEISHDYRLPVHSVTYYYVDLDSEVI